MAGRKAITPDYLEDLRALVRDRRLTIGHAAAELGISRRTATRLIRDARITGQWQIVPSENYGHIRDLPEWHAVRADVLDRDGHECVKCMSTSHLQVDHIVPLDVLFAYGVDDDALAAALDPDNLRTLCRVCNGRKGNRIEPTEHLETWVSPKWPELGYLLEPTAPSAGLF